MKTHPSHALAQNNNLQFVQKALLVILGSIFLTLASYLSIPLPYVPFTLQTYAVLLIGAFYGPKLGVLTVVTWLTQAALGLPVLADGKMGLLAFVGPTAGYLFAFPFMAFITGYALYNKALQGIKLIYGFMVFSLASALCLTFGGLWLAFLTTPEIALMNGVIPFVFSSLIKASFATATFAIYSAYKSYNA